MVQLGRFFSLCRAYVLANKRQYSRPKFFTSKDPIVLYEDRNKIAIYHGKGMRIGFEETFSGKKTRRIWKPNVRSKVYWSDLMQESYPVRITTRAMRSIDKAGGFDNYMTRTKEKLMTTQKALKLKNILVKAAELKAADPSRAIEDIKLEADPPKPPHPKDRIHTNRFYFQWYGTRRHIVYC